MQWVCSLRDSLQGLDPQTAGPPYEPASHFPLGAGHNGHREAPLLICNFLRVTQATLRCKSRNRLISCALRDLVENNNGPLITQPKAPVERRRFLWETASEPRQLGLKACSEPDQNCRKLILRTANTRPTFSFSDLEPPSGTGNNPQIGQSVHEELHGQRHQQKAHDSDQDPDTSLPQHGPDPACPGKH